MKLTLTKSCVIDDWYLIERAEHDGKSWLEKTGPNTSAFRRPSRISDADVEGHAAEMMFIAKAIRDRDEVSFRRCAVDARKEPVRFWSPRNSQHKGGVSYAEALELAKVIESLIHAPEVEEK